MDYGLGVKLLKNERKVINKQLLNNGKYKKINRIKFGKTSLSVVILHSVFHGIRFKVKRISCRETINLFYFIRILHEVSQDF